MQSCDEVHLANGASASDQGHNGKAAVALHALMLLPSIHHLAHNLNTCNTCTTLSFCGFSSQIYHVLDSFLRRVIFASWTPPPSLINDYYQSHRSLSPPFTRLHLTYFKQLPLWCSVTAYNRYRTMPSWLCCPQWGHSCRCLQQIQGPLPSRQSCALHVYNSSGMIEDILPALCKLGLEAATCMC